MRLPQKDHPIWKLLQGTVSLASLCIYVAHTPSHPAGVVFDPPDTTGLVGVTLALKLAWQSLKGAK